MSRMTSSVVTGALLALLHLLQPAPARGAACCYCVDGSWAEAAAAAGCAGACAGNPGAPGFGAYSYPGPSQWGVCGQQCSNENSRCGPPAQRICDRNTFFRDDYTTCAKTWGAFNPVAPNPPALQFKCDAGEWTSCPSGTRCNCDNWSPANVGSSCWCINPKRPGGKNTAYLPPDAPNGPIAKCEDKLSKAAGKLWACIAKCQQGRATGKLPDDAAEEVCKSGDPAKSCLAKFNKARAKLLADADCPACIGLVDQGTEIAAFADAININLYCASPSGAFVDDVGPR